MPAFQDARREEGMLGRLYAKNNRNVLVASFIEARGLGLPPKFRLSAPPDADLGLVEGLELPVLIHNKINIKGNKISYGHSLQSEYFGYFKTFEYLLWYS